MQRRPRRATTTTALPSRGDLAIALAAGLLLVPASVAEAGDALGTHDAGARRDAGAAEDAGTINGPPDAGASVADASTDGGDAATATLVLDPSGPPELIEELSLDGKPLDAKALGQEIPITPGEHRLSFRRHDGPAEERVIDAFAGRSVTVYLAPREPILGGVAPTPPSLRGGCCGGDRSAGVASFPGGVSALFGLALWVGRRRRR